MAMVCDTSMLFHPPFQVLRKEVTPPLVPAQGPTADDTRNFDREFTRMAVRDTPSSLATPLKNSFEARLLKLVCVT
jgi:hypothetical protein